MIAKNGFIGVILIDMNWYDNLGSEEAMIQAIDFNERLDSEGLDILFEEFEEDQHRESLKIFV